MPYYKIIFESKVEAHSKEELKKILDEQLPSYVKPILIEKIETY